MRKCTPLILIGLILIAVLAHAELQKGLKVTASICEGIQDREPVGEGESFPPETEKLYCHSLVEGVEDSTAITHIWYYGPKEMARVELPVKSPHWRTWSSKRILPQWEGWWRVDVLSVEGDTLTSAYFVVK